MTKNFDQILSGVLNEMIAPNPQATTPAATPSPTSTTAPNKEDEAINNIVNILKLQPGIFAKIMSHPEVQKISKQPQQQNAPQASQYNQTNATNKPV
jgi:hypothetical protein